MAYRMPNRECEFVASVLERAAWESPFWTTVLYRVRSEHGIGYDPERMIDCAHFLSKSIADRCVKGQSGDDFVNCLPAGSDLIVDIGDHRVTDATRGPQLFSVTEDDARVIAARLVAYAATGVATSGEALDLLKCENFDGDPAN